MKKLALIIFSFFAISIVSAQSFNFSNAYIVGTDSVPCVICSIDLYYGKPFEKMETQISARYFYISYSYVNSTGIHGIDFINSVSWAGHPKLKDILETIDVKNKGFIKNATIISMLEMKRDDFNSFFGVACQ